MPTLKDRINITVDPTLFSELTERARAKHLSLATYTKDLVEKALDLEEDRYYSAVADERLAAKRVMVDHEKAWG
jgi:hypothetical protein